MVSYILKSRPGQFLLVGTLLLLFGMFLQYNDIESYRYVFYLSIIFLGFFAFIDAVVETVKSKAPNVDLLMILAAIGACIIDYASEGALLLFIFALSSVLESYAMNKSTKAISSLMAQVPEEASLLLPNGDVQRVDVTTLRKDDQIIVQKGALIPIDGVIDRRASIDESSLTGESLPVEKQQGDDVFAGTLNVGEVVQMTVSKTSDETVFSNIIRMVETAQNRPSKLSSFIDRIEKKYVISVLIAVPLFIAVMYYFNGFSFEEAFYRGMVFLTVASPCALVASATPATLSAISRGARDGILVKGGKAMESLTSMNVLFSDKTGTLTYGQFDVVDYQIDDSILAEVIYMEQQSTHPIAKALVRHFGTEDLSSVDQTEDIEEIVGSGVRKGHITVAKPSFFEGFNDPNGYLNESTKEYTTIIVGAHQEVVGYFNLADTVRKEAKEAVALFQSEGVDVRLLTGDHEVVAKAVASTVNIDQYVASCLPEDKIKYVNDSIQQGDIVGMIGDGINDAPALANANIGIAMGEGSTVAMESSDVVIVKNDLLKLFNSFILSRKLNRTIKFNVMFSIIVIIILIMLNIFGLLSLPTAVLFHEGSTILVILNGLRLLLHDRN